MTNMASNPRLFFVGIFVELAIFEVGHQTEHDHRNTKMTTK